MGLFFITLCILAAKLVSSLYQDAIHLEAAILDDSNEVRSEAFVNDGLIGIYQNGSWHRGPMGKEIDFNTSFWKIQADIYETLAETSDPIRRWARYTKKSEIVILTSLVEIYDDGNFAYAAFGLSTGDDTISSTCTFFRDYKKEKKIDWSLHGLPDQRHKHFRSKLNKNMPVEKMRSLVEAGPNEIKKFKKTESDFFRNPNATARANVLKNGKLNITCTADGFFPLDKVSTKIMYGNKEFSEKAEDMYARGDGTEDEFLFGSGFEHYENGLWYETVWTIAEESDKCDYVCIVNHYEKEKTAKLPECN